MSKPRPVTYLNDLIALRAARLERETQTLERQSYWLIGVVVVIFVAEIVLAVWWLW
jgi:hypothetical protein